VHTLYCLLTTVYNCHCPLADAPSLRWNVVPALCRDPRFFGQEGGGPIRAWKEAAAAAPLDLGALQAVPWGTASPLPRPKGHVVAVRITSEDPDDGFKPTCGKVDVSGHARSVCCWGYPVLKLVAPRAHLEPML